MMAAEPVAKRPRMAWKDDTLRFDFLYKRKGFDDSVSDQWIREQAERGVPVQVALPAADPVVAATTSSSGLAPAATTTPTAGKTNKKPKSG